MQSIEQEWRELHQLEHSKSQILHKHTNNVQDELIMINAHRQLVTKDIIHKNIQQILRLLPGSFSQNRLEMELVSNNISNQTTVQVQAWWNASKSSFGKEKNLNLVDATMYKYIKESHLLKNTEQYIFFLNCIALDILNEITRQSWGIQQYKNIDLLAMNKKLDLFERFSATMILQFLNEALPNVLFNFLLKEELPVSLQHYKQLQCLYFNKEVEYMIKKSPNYMVMLMTMIQLVFLKVQQMTTSQQQVLMDIVFRYYYVLHSTKGYKAIEIFLQAFNLISTSVRYAMAQNYLLFLKISKKIGKHKFVDFLLKQSSWLKQIYEKTNTENRQIGLNIQDVQPFDDLDFEEKVFIEAGRTERRFFESFQDNSFLYLQIKVLAYDIDITVRPLMGILNDSALTVEPVKYQKVTADEFSQIFLLPSKGIYAIEFDNTKSWIHHKNVLYRKVLLIPLEIQLRTKWEWLSNVYFGVEFTSVTEDKMIYYNLKTFFIVRVSKREELYTFTIKEKDTADEQLARYQTDSPSRFLEKLRVISKNEKNQFVVDTFEGENDLVRQIWSIVKRIGARDNVVSVAKSKKKESKNKQQLLIEIPLKN